MNILCLEFITVFLELIDEVWMNYYYVASFHQDPFSFCFHLKMVFETVKTLHGDKYCVLLAPIQEKMHDH